jgi:SAM-dependent methyltransferase
VGRPVPRRIRRGVFGRDPAAYARARLPYPARVFEILEERCGLRPGAAVFEIGPGTGIATRELLRRGARPLTLIERDLRLVRYLRASLPARSPGLTIRAGPFESVRLAPASFDLGVAATSFHWLPERQALRKVARTLRPGGWWASWNTHHGDPYRPNPFGRALRPLYRELSPHGSGRGPARAAALKDARGRLRALKDVGRFDEISREEVHWSATLTASHARALWGSFSDVVTLPPAKRARFLDGLERVATDEFGNRVELAVLTPVYTARRT